ncbi:hypothetical protein [Catellatospora sp. IY07-71]|uniref:hypothetical protein n=1 Tax=Catellatospora sp. IY07-71 TaxID=2728827 RepID=UPI001BB2F4F4|nr:hypothetical protein [Catellatospora sp. IY07-71]
MVKPSTWFSRTRRAWNLRYTKQVLRLARAAHEQWSDDLAGSATLDEQAVARLKPILRTHEVQRAAFHRWPGWWCYLALRVVTALVAVSVPVWGLVRSGPEPLWAALVCYLCVGGTVALGYGIHQHRVRAWQLAAAVSAGSLGMATTWAVGSPADRAALWRAFGAGVLAAGALLVLTMARLTLLLAVLTRVMRPRAVRRAGWLLPSQYAAVLLLNVLLTSEEARPANRVPRFRVNFLRWLAGTTDYIRWEVTSFAGSLELAAHLTRDATERAAMLTAYLRTHQTRLMHDDSLSVYDVVIGELATAVTALAAGDWSPLEAAEATVDEPSRFRRLARHVRPAAVLTATAIGLPYLPGVPDGGTALVGIQLGLVAAAALSLMPPLEQAHRDQITNAFSSAAK